MVDIKQIKPGMKVRIADRWDSRVVPPPSSMRKWFGQIIEVKDVKGDFVVMDGGDKDYYWLAWDIDCIVCEVDVEFDEAEFLSLFS